MIEQLKEQIKVVAEARKDKAYYDEAIRELKVVWENHNKRILGEAATNREVMESAEAKLRELTLEVYAETGNKTPADGVGIREVTKLEYDTKTAYNWAIEHSMALNLDKRGFEKIAKVSPPDFVTITKEPQATIATNLDEIRLEEKDEPRSKNKE